jgi:hypothetical protein
VSAADLLEADNELQDKLTGIYDPNSVPVDDSGQVPAAASPGGRRRRLLRERAVPRIDS